MNMQAQKRRLGRGLAALIGEDVNEDAVVEDIRSLGHVAIEHLHANPNNPRKHFAEGDLAEVRRFLERPAEWSAAHGGSGGEGAKSAAG